MPHLIVIAASLALVGQPENEEVKVVGRPWAPFISPMGEPFRANAVGDDPFARWFRQADRNSDGGLTADEMQADGERFFRTLDTDGNGVIDPDELTIYESQVAPEVQVNSRWKRSPEALAELRTGKSASDKERWRADAEIDGYQIRGLQGAARYGLLNIPEPVAGADADFNRGTTLAEFRQAAIQRFQILDEKRIGRLTLEDLEPLLPSRPNGKKTVKLPKDAPHDTRVGLPLPQGN
jgi:hypothetical protein